METKQKNIAMLAYSCANMDIVSVRKKANGKNYQVLETVTMASPELSSYRNPGDNSPVKLSAVALLLDKVLVRKRVLAYTSTTQKALYCEIDEVPFLVDAEGVHVQEEESGIADPYILWAYTLYHAYAEKEEEFNQCLEKCFSEYLMRHAVSESVAGGLCDSFYYWHASNKKLTLAVTNDLLLETVTAAFRSGAFKNALPKAGLVTPAKVSLESPMAEAEGNIPKANATGKAKKNSDAELFEAAKRGELILDYDWDEDSKKHITPLSFLDSFVPNETYFSLLKKLLYRLGKIKERMDAGMSYTEAIGRWDHVEASLIGSPGTGKSVTVYAVGASLGIPIRMDNLSHDTDEEFAEGKNRLVNGRPQAVPTEVLEGVMHGGIVLLEEVNLPQAAVVMGALGQTVEYPFTLKKNGYETINRHPLCVFISTMNIGTAGSKAVSEPFSNRFRTTYYMEDAPKKTFIDTLVKASGMKRYICDWVFSVYEKVVNALKSDQFGAADTESILLSLSLRSCEGVLQGIEEGLDPKEAVNYSLIYKIAERDISVAAQLQDLVENMKDLHIEGGVRDV